MNPLIESALSLLLPTVVLIHLFCAPFTKVEESFNIQATHDILFYGIPTTNVTESLSKNYDHVSFPGSVPRTFIGALVLAGLSRPWAGWFASPFRIQLLARAILGLSNSFAMLALSNAVSRAFGKAAGVWYILFQASQFHAIYYASRTLPNSFAFGLTTLALRSVLLAASEPTGSVRQAKQLRLGLYILTVAGVIFRSELAILLATTARYFMSTERLSFMAITFAGVVGAVIGLLATVSIDSFFWQANHKTPLWPELTAFIYNTLQGHASDWGVEPWYFYIANAIPRQILNPLIWLVCIPTAIVVPATRLQSLDLLVPLVGFVAIYSILPHKEARFVIYTIPGLTAVASAGAAFISNRMPKAFVYRALTLMLAASVVVSFVASSALLAISSLNYPGGAALMRLHAMEPPGIRVIRVHLDNLSCQTGVTRFLERHPLRTAAAGLWWVYDKTEDQEKFLDPLWWQQFDFVLVERQDKVIGTWETIDTIYGFAGVKLLRPTDKEEALEEGSAGETRKQKLKPDLGGIGPFWALYTRIEEMGRKATGGWWITLKLEPKIRILRQQK